VKDARSDTEPARPETSPAAVRLDSARDAIVESVRALYEAHPYPRYPLLAKPKWRDGYLATSLFSARLAGDLGHPGQVSRGRPQILVAGAGEILPYVMRKWEPAHHCVVNVDLSSASLRRARFRCFPSLAPSSYLAADLDDTLARVEPESLTHVDAYGVLHHQPNPSATLALIAAALAPGGTLRLMVYNAAAREWIRETQRFLAHFALDPTESGDVTWAQRLIEELADELPPLRDYLAAMGRGTTGNAARFADAFLHPREARLDVEAWLGAATSAGLSALGMLDRYAELDDLANPLWSMPNATALAERAADRRFENNLELFLVKGAATLRHGATAAPARPLGASRAWSSLGLAPFGAPPRTWFNYTETADLSRLDRFSLWSAHLAWTRAGRRTITNWKVWPRVTLARLARLGAILPGMVARAADRDVMTAPLEPSMEPPSRPTPMPSVNALTRLPAGALVAQKLDARGRFTTKRWHAALERLSRISR
jgi:SAM-dependent methyltransferase